MGETSSRSVRFKWVPSSLDSWSGRGNERRLLRSEEILGNEIGSSIERTGCFGENQTFETSESGNKRTYCNRCACERRGWKPMAEWNLRVKFIRVDFLTPLLLGTRHLSSEMCADCIPVWLWVSWKHHEIGHYPFDW